ncbi:MAG: hypothetical protein HY548_05590 [Elusimicrobia bacterium]|nr:hypothetical protein [Elusimicrobiota bacterium]
MEKGKEKEDEKKEVCDNGFPFFPEADSSKKSDDAEATKLPFALFEFNAKYFQNVKRALASLQQKKKE